MAASPPPAVNEAYGRVVTCQCVEYCVSQSGQFGPLFTQERERIPLDNSSFRFLLKSPLSTHLMRQETQDCANNPVGMTNEPARESGSGWRVHFRLSTVRQSLQSMLTLPPLSLFNEDIRG
ncbi:hypothetical protein T03_10202 [Trichinella britovi]|uniref:Uncharacterized protein n=1 Tax=Trichinella britovi TaxID=45882 RepID=A0A0V1CEZ3_TRIBR|nr:hypothetical protein T03_10202 [Trichinella britovi]